MSEANETQARIVELEGAFNQVQDLLKQAAELVSNNLFPAENGQTNPVTGKARYESVTKLEEAHMWIANGVQSLIQMDEKLGQVASQMAAGNEDLQVVK